MSPEKNSPAPPDLIRLGGDEDAGLWIASVPCPAAGLPKLSLDGRATSSFALGQWPGGGAPRRYLLVGHATGPAPATLRLSPPTPAASATAPDATSELFDENQPGEFVWQRHFLRLSWGGRSLGLALGLRTRGEVHWWEACRLIVRERQEHCLTVEMAGAIPVEVLTPELFAHGSGFNHPHLHKHNWLNGSIFARLHSNGVCEIYARHINSRFVNDGADFEDVVPVIGFRTECNAPAAGESTTTLEIDGARLDLTEASRLGSPSHPGAFFREKDFLVWKPYEVELYGGAYPQEMTGHPFLLRAADKAFPKGLARTLRFSVSLSSASPRVARYIAPVWWYGHCEEFLPAPLLPVKGELEPQVDSAREWVRKLVVRSGFEDGSVPRNTQVPHTTESGAIRNEAGWEGDMVYAQFLAAWRSGETDDYEIALRGAYFFTDVGIDHATKIGRMHGFNLGAGSLPMSRVHGTLAAYLETGDPYLLQTAQAVVTSAHALHKNSWPRLAVGRDASYLRSVVMLYRYFGDDFYRRMAEEIIDTVLEVQRPDGSFADQGGGTGFHAWGGYIFKPWMGLLALNGVLDYLELIPDHPRARAAVKRFADWLLAEQWEFNGVKGWSYQHGYNGGRDFITPKGVMELPTKDRWHHETLARLLGYVAIEFGEARYLQAWAQSTGKSDIHVLDHAISAAMQFLPWLQARLWNARYEDGAISVAPISFGPGTPQRASIATPFGPVAVSCDLNGEIDVPASITIRKVRRLT